MSGMNVHIHRAKDFRLTFGGDPTHSVCWIDAEWDHKGDAEVSFFVPHERREHYKRAVEAFNAVLADESIKDVVPTPWPDDVAETDDDMVDF